MRKHLSISLLGSLGAVSGTTSYTTVFQPINSFNGYMIQLVYTGTPTATVTLEVSADGVPTNWYDVVLDTAPQPTYYDTVPNSSKSTSSVTANSSGQYVITYDVPSTAGNWVRLRWTNASGTGTITSINLVAKGAMV